MIVDYPWQHPGGGALKAAGVQGVVRYLSHDASKTLQRSEADDLWSHGIPMAVVFEDMAQRALDGYTAGANDAQVAMQMLGGQRSGYSNLEMPNDRPIYFAADFDSQWPQIAQYYAGAASVLGQNRVGIYGGLAAVTGAANAGYRWLWQTGAWSHGQWHPKAVLRQEIAEITINGVQCDVNDHQADDWGQWAPGEDVVNVPTPEDYANAVWQHTETDADNGKPVRFGAVMAWMDKVHNNQRADVAAVKAELDGVKATLAEILGLLQQAKP